MKLFSKLVAIVFCSSLCLLWNSCSNGSDSAPIIISSPSGGGTTTTPTGTGTDNGGGTQTPTPTPTPTPTQTPTPNTYTVTFNANDGSETPATATQTFTEGTPQALKTIAELGFSKAGFNFAGWGTTNDSTQSSYADGSSYTATANTTLYALWSAIPVYSVNIPVNEHGTVTASPATATAGTEITLSATPKAGYDFVSYTVIAADGSAVTVANGKFKMPAQNVTATTVFQMNAETRGAYTKEGTVTIDSKEYDMVTFGLWPQTIIAPGVTVDDSVTEPHGAFTYCRGSDGEWYVKQAERAYENGYKYSDGKTTVGQDGTSEKWFKVEPIKWRVLTTNYGGNKLLLAERILTGGVKYYIDQSSRLIGGKTIYPNNYKYSTIRAYLNGAYETDDTQTATHSGKGFLQSSFTSAQQSAMPATTVDNTAASATYAGGNSSQDTSYACDNTSDKIFLLSEKEVTTSVYGFAGASVYIGDANATPTSTRTRKITDFALATGALQSSNTKIAGRCGLWWLRSPLCLYDNNAHIVNILGDAWNYSKLVDCSDGGIVPALCVAN